MQAEERKEIEANSLEKWARNTWEKLSKVSIYTYVLLIGVGVLLFLAWGWYTGSQVGKKAGMWVELEQLDSREKLKKFVEEHRDDIAGSIARLRIARIDMGPEGLLKLGTRDQTQRKEALTNLIEARKIYLEVVPQLKDNAAFQVEAWLGAAKAEETLIGAILPEKPDENLGNLAKAIEFYEKAAAILNDNEEGKALQEYIKKLRDNSDQIVKNYTEYHLSMKPLMPIDLEPKKEEPKKEEPKKEEPKKEEPKKEEPKKVEVKKEEPKKEEVKKEEPKKEEPKKEEPKK